MTRLEALEAVAAAARDLVTARTTTGVPRFERVAALASLVDALAALDQAAPQPPGVDPQPHRGESTPMIPDLLAQAYGEEQR